MGGADVSVEDKTRDGGRARTGGRAMSRGRHRQRYFISPFYPQPPHVERPPRDDCGEALCGLSVLLGLSLPVGTRPAT